MGSERRCRVEIEAAESLTDNMKSLEGALAELQARLDEARAAQGAAADSRAVVRAAQGVDQGAADLDTPALSASERTAVLSEVAGDAQRDFETGVGINARSYLNFLAGGSVVLAAEEGAAEEASVRVTAQAGEASGASVDVVAAPDSALTLTVSLDSDASEPAFTGSTLRVFAGARSRVDVTVYVTGSDAVTAVEDSGFVLDEGARVNVRHVVLGGRFAATGLAADLRGDRSRIDIDTSYLAGGSSQRDFNYVIRHRGKKTVSNMDANGVLTGTAKKCLRGTIDLIHGAKGAEGQRARDGAAGLARGRQQDHPHHPVRRGRRRGQPRRDHRPRPPRAALLRRMPRPVAGADRGAVPLRQARGGGAHGSDRRDPRPCDPSGQPDHP